MKGLLKGILKEPLRKGTPLWNPEGKESLMGILKESMSTENDSCGFVLSVVKATSVRLRMKGRYCTQITVLTHFRGIFY